MGFINREPLSGDLDSEAPFRRSLEQLSEQLASRRPEPPTHVDIAAKDPDDTTFGMRPALKVAAAALLAIAVIATIYSFRRHEPATATPKVADVRPSTPPVEPKPALPTPTTALIVPPPDPAVATPSATPSTTPPARTSTPPISPPVALDRNGIREVQTRLRAIGLDPGPIDGTMGPLTERAVRRYVDQRGKGPLGLDSELLRQLQQEDGASTAHRQ